LNKDERRFSEEKEELIKRHSRELTALMKSSTEMLHTTDLRQRLKVICEAIRETGWRRCVISLRDEDLNVIDLVTAGLTQEEVKYLWDNRQPGHVWRARLGQDYERFRIGEFYYLPWSDPFVRERFAVGTVPSKIPPEEMIDWDPQDLLYMPLRLPDGRIVGIVSIDDPVDGRRPTKDSLAPLELFGHQAAVAIENALLIRELEAARNQVKEYADRLELKVEERTRELRESERKYQSVVENATDGICIVQDGVFVFVNKRLAEMSGYPIEDYIGKPMLSHIPERYHSSITKLFRQVMAERRVLLMPFDVHIKTKQGKELSVETSSTIIEYGGKPAILTIARDVTERERMQKELENAYRMAAIGELAASVGHDLRNPLTGISGAVYYLKMKLAQKLDKKSREMLDLMESDVQYSNKIVNDLLDFSKEIRLQPTKTNVKVLLADVLSKDKVPKNVKVVDLTKKTPIIMVDTDQMKRVFENLITNAVQAMPKGGTLKIKSEEVNGSLKITFGDNGVGISKQNFGKLFAPLFTTKAKGVGLGLSICKRIVDAHKGSISAESEEGKGTCFTVVIPIKEKRKRVRQKRKGGEKEWQEDQTYLLSTTTPAYEKFSQPS